MSEAKVLDEMSPYPPKEVPEWKKKHPRMVGIMVCVGCRARGVTLKNVDTKKGKFMFCLRCAKTPGAVKAFVDSLEQADA